MVGHMIALALALALPLQGKPPGKIDQARVDQAIQKGVEYLKGRSGRGREQELVLLAMAHGGRRSDDPVFAGLLRAMLDEPLDRTYNVALQAMVLEEIERVKHQKRIFQCAQFLVDNQNEMGKWSYGEPTTFPDPQIRDVATGQAGPKPGQVVIFGDPEPGQKPPVRQRIPVKQQRQMSGGGDNSNSQYAALGLRACHDAGIVLPKEVVERAADWWRRCQTGDGGWG